MTEKVLYPGHFFLGTFFLMFLIGMFSVLRFSFKNTRDMKSDVLLITISSIMGSISELVYLFFNGYQLASADIILTILAGIVGGNLGYLVARGLQFLFSQSNECSNRGCQNSECQETKKGLR